MKLVFATNNQHKLDEIRAIIGDNFEILSLKDIGCVTDIPEDFETLQENAAQKAEYIYQKYGYNCFADDTGLEIEALNMRPGVYSARYAGEDKNSEKNMDKVLDELKGKTDRKARFRTVISLIIKGKHHFFEGIVKGDILTERHGVEGFGYDPIFKPEGYNVSFAEMDMKIKNTISHRGRAVAKLVEFLNRQEF